MAAYEARARRGGRRRGAVPGLARARRGQAGHRRPRRRLRRPASRGRGGREPAVGRGARARPPPARQSLLPARATSRAACENHGRALELARRAGAAGARGGGARRPRRRRVRPRPHDLRPRALQRVRRRLPRARLRPHRGRQRCRWSASPASSAGTTCAGRWRTRSTAVEAARRVGHQRGGDVGPHDRCRDAREPGRAREAKVQIAEVEALARRLGARRFEPLHLNCHAQGPARRRAPGRGAEAARARPRDQPRDRRSASRGRPPWARSPSPPTTRRCGGRRWPRARRLLAAGSVAHNHFRFYRDAIEASLAGRRVGRGRAPRGRARGLHPPGAPAVGGFYVARGRALAAWGRGRSGRRGQGRGSSASPARPGAPGCTSPCRALEATLAPA